ncbi:MAG: ATP-dependent Clp protease ATP-binding subunit [Candidatus Azambacteria bacterium]|nr:ATP-dependent Clp protease ATP-binding subunit [Candidatus Azambacteria bacterium]
MNLSPSFKNRLTSRAENILKFAENLANNSPNARHLLEAIFTIRGSLAYNILQNHNLNLSDFSFPSRNALPLKTALKSALEEAMKYNYSHIGTEHLLWGALEEMRGCVKTEKLQMVVNTENHLKEIFSVSGRTNNLKDADLPKSRTYGQNVFDKLIIDAYKNLVNLPEILNNDQAKEPSSALETFGTELVEAAKKGTVDPTIGREKEIKRIITVMSRHNKNNPMLIGEPGVGKTALVYGLAQKIAASDVPPFLLKKSIYQLDLGAIVAGTTFRGEFEARIKDVLYEAEEKNAVIFIDEFHTVIGAGAAQGSLDVANIIKPLLSMRKIQIIGATTISEWRKHIEKDAALERRFQPIMIDEPTVTQTEEILLGLLPALEKHHNLKIAPEAIKSAVVLATRYLNDRFLPDKAIDLLDEAAALKALENNLPTVLKSADVARALNTITGIPIKNLTGPKNDLTATPDLTKIEKKLGQKIIGQKEGVRIIAETLRRADAGLNNKERPLGSFLFIGPTGVGKTELAKILHQEISPSTQIIKFDMSEFLEAHSIAKLIGSPPGYIGYEEPGNLTEKIRRNPYAVVLFDEIEKAHPQIANILLQIIEEGNLTDNHGRRTSFKNAIIILTSNLGSKEFSREAKRFGFISNHKKSLRDKYSEIKEAGLKALRRHFVPELLSRLDEIIVFNPLGPIEIRKIAVLEIKKITKEIADYKINVKNSVFDFIITKAEFHQNGAREIKRLINKMIVNPLAEFLLNKKNISRKDLDINIKNNKVIIT